MAEKNQSSPAQEAPASKSLVTIRLDLSSKLALDQIAADSKDDTVSSLINLAVREFLERRTHGTVCKPDGVLRVRHAPLPDTSVLKAYSKYAKDAETTRTNLRLPKFDFEGPPAEWRRLPSFLKSRDADIVESVNCSALFALIKKAESSPELDWIGPFLQLFVGHHVFIRRDHLERYFAGSDHLRSFDRFQSEAKNGRDLSLRSLIAWARSANKPEIAVQLQRCWADAVVACQLGTDYEIAVRRVAPILSRLGGSNGAAPVVHGYDFIGDFRNGTISGISGSLLTSASLLADERACLIAGPADLRIPSLNILAGQKELLASASGQPSQAGGPEVQAPRDRILAYWNAAVRWFREDVVAPESNVELRKFVSEEFRSSFDCDRRIRDSSPSALEILHSLMQNWVKWFATPQEAADFLGSRRDVPIVARKDSAKANGQREDEVVAVGTEDLVQHYKELCDLLNPVNEMTAPDLDSAVERALWKFPTLPATSLTRRTEGRTSEKAGRPRGKNARSS